MGCGIGMVDVIIVLGLGFGDEGKGSLVDHLARRHGSKLVVRFNGGAQASHAVVTDDGREHRFSQWSSGTFAGARTLLTRFMMCNPIFAASEARHLESVGIADPWSLLHVERDALITTPFHVAANRLQEIARRAAGSGVHGSCGMGIGETMRDAVDGRGDCIFARDLANEEIWKKLIQVRERKRAETAKLDLDRTRAEIAKELFVLEDRSVIGDVAALYEQFARQAHIVDEAFLARELAGDGHMIFEGAQGVLLDEWWGFHPHTTWSTCTFENAEKLLRETGFSGSVQRLGVLRSYHTRHGAGPFPTGGAEWDAFSVDDHNTRTPWQHAFRSGPFDMVLARYALDVLGKGGCDGLAITHLDKLHTRERVPVAWGYRMEGRVVKNLTRKIPNDLSAQESLGRSLESAKPMYEFAEGGSRDAATRYALMIGEALGLSVGITSGGKTSSAKTELARLSGRAA